MRKLKATIILCTALGLVLGFSASSSSIAAGPVQITMWVNGDCPPATCPEAALIKGFEAANPNLKIKLISQPPDNYWATLKAAVVTGTGPDLADMFAGGYMTPFKKYMVDARKYVPAKLISQSIGTNFYSEGNSNKNAVYAIPRENQFYIGFYNKKIFADNGITKIPSSWSELSAVSAKLAKAGIRPIVDGAQGGSAQIEPLFEFSYLATAHPIADWTKLLNGKLAFDNPILRQQVTSWADLYKKGYINKDAYNYPNTEQDFTDGKAAMFLGTGSWELPAIAKIMGDNLGVMVPPFSPTGKKMLIALPGAGYTMFKASKHQVEAGKFQAFMLSDAGQQILADLGQPPTRPGFKTSLAPMNDLLKISGTPGLNVYPMFDNFTQPAVTDAIHKKIAQALVGQLTASQALKAIDSATASLPADLRNAALNFDGK